MTRRSAPGLFRGSIFPPAARPWLVIALAGPGTIAASELSIPFRLDALASQLEQISSEHRSPLRLTRDPQFPCLVELAVTTQRPGRTLHERYRFDMTDLEKGFMFAAKNQHRAISYYSTLVRTGSPDKINEPKKINNFNATPGAQEEVLKPAQELVDQIIGRCGEENEF